MYSRRRVLLPPRAREEREIFDPGMDGGGKLTGTPGASTGNIHPKNIPQKYARILCALQKTRELQCARENKWPTLRLNYVSPFIVISAFALFQKRFLALQPRSAFVRAARSKAACITPGINTEKLDAARSTRASRRADHLVHV